MATADQALVRVHGAQTSVSIPGWICVIFGFALYALGAWVGLLP